MREKSVVGGDQKPYCATPEDPATSYLKSQNGHNYKLLLTNHRYVARVDLATSPGEGGGAITRNI